MRYSRYLAIALGLLAAFVVIVLAEMLAGQLFPLPVEIDPSDYEAIDTYMREQATTKMFLSILGGYVLGAFAGGFVAARMEKRDKKLKMRGAMIVGIVLMAFGIMNLTMLYHPLWFWIASITCYIPCAWAGGKLGIQNQK